MRPYLRLLRIQDQYPVFGGALAAGIYLGIRQPWIVWWGMACVCISMGAFVINELVDRADVDRYSWNPIHISRDAHLNTTVVRFLYTSVTITGLAISAWIGMLFWASFLVVWSALYSLPPVRLKARPIVDILTQVVAGWIAPFGLPIILSGAGISDWMILGATALCGWAIVYPYQLSDFTADQRANLYSTHVVIGMRKSFLLVAILSTFGMILFFTADGLSRAPWLILAPVLSAAPLYLVFARWLPGTSITRKEKELRRYVGWMKPLTQLSLLYIIVLWFVWK